MAIEKSTQNNNNMSLIGGFDFKASSFSDSSKYVTYTLENGNVIHCLKSDPLFDVIKNNEKFEIKKRHELKLLRQQEELARAERKEKSTILDQIMREMRHSDGTDSELEAEYKIAKKDFWSSRFSLTAAGNRVFSALETLKEYAFEDMKSINAMTFNYNLSKSLG